MVELRRDPDGTILAIRRLAYRFGEWERGAFLTLLPLSDALAKSAPVSYAEAVEGRAASTVQKLQGWIRYVAEIEEPPPRSGCLVSLLEIFRRRKWTLDWSRCLEIVELRVCDDGDLLLVSHRVYGFGKWDRGYRSTSVNMPHVWEMTSPVAFDEAEREAGLPEGLLLRFLELKERDEERKMTRTTGFVTGRLEDFRPLRDEDDLARG